MSNNKENGFHFLAQPDRMNVQTTNLSEPNILYILKFIYNPPNVAAETMRPIAKLYLSLDNKENGFHLLS